MPQPAPRAEREALSGQTPDLSGRCPDGEDDTVRTHADTREATDTGPRPTRADTARTRTNNGPADTGQGVRYAYRARVPRHLTGAAFAEGLALLGAELYVETEPEPESLNRRAQSAAAIAAAFDLPPDIVRKEPRAVNPIPGMLVHYVGSYDTWVGDYTSRCRAAFITTVHPSTGAGTLADLRGREEVDLAVLHPDAPFYEKTCRHSEGSQPAGTWHWADGCSAEPLSALQRTEGPTG